MAFLGIGGREVKDEQPHHQALQHMARRHTPCDGPVALGRASARKMLVCGVLTLFLGSRSVRSVPLQWEQISAVGESPSARHSHAAVGIDAMQGNLFIFGG